MQAIVAAEFADRRVQALGRLLVGGGELGPGLHGGLLDVQRNTGVHGAIGVTHEFDLQLYTRRLNEWARAGGGAGYWSGILGQQILGAKSSALDFVRTELFTEPAV